MACKVRRTSRGSSSEAENDLSSRTGWAELPEDLVRDVARRVVASESSCRRRSTVACAGVCRHWRIQVEEALGVPRGSGLVAFLLSSDPPAKLVGGVVEHAMRDPEGKVMNDVAKAADGLVVSLADQISKTTSSLSLTGALEASREHVENALLQIFQFENRRLSRAVTEATFELLITKLLLGIVDERPLHTRSEMQPQGSLDALLLKILDNVDRTSSYVVLISLLRPSKQPSLAGNPRFHKLVIRCLMRYTSVIKSTIHFVHPDSVLHSIHECLQELGTLGVRRRAATSDSPLHMILTFLHELVNILGTLIKGYLSRIPRDMVPRPLILRYIDRYLQTLAASGRPLGLPVVYGNW
ncbi:hypothetical protein BT93_D1825 [Corymbia citriodora subsp. variegata]|nr:hypothetical protein BT93_D1825 [Corymbia citriodora subsp. variegata]